MKKTINYGLLMLVMLFTMASNIFADNKYGLKDNIQEFYGTMEEAIGLFKQALLKYEELLLAKK